MTYVIINILFCVVICSEVAIFIPMTLCATLHA